MKGNGDALRELEAGRLGVVLSVVLGSVHRWFDLRHADGRSGPADGLAVVNVPIAVDRALQAGAPRGGMASRDKVTGRFATPIEPQWPQASSCSGMHPRGSRGRTMR